MKKYWVQLVIVSVAESGYCLDVDNIFSGYN